MVLESALSFLGIGVKPPIPSWGNMISDGLRVWRAHPHLLAHSVHARLVGVLDGGLERRPKLFLIGCQSEAGLHAGELGVQHRLAIGRPALHALGA